MMSMPAAFSQHLVHPNMPLRRPSTKPGTSTPSVPVSLSNLTPPMEPARPLATSVGDGASGGANSMIGMENFMLMGSMLPASAFTVNLCNYCSQPGNFRCMHCKKTYYCSVLCQTEDWKAHRHLCVFSTPDPANEKPKDAPAVMGMGDGPSTLESKVKSSDASSPQKVYLRDLRKNDIAKGAEIQASVVELYSPGRFFLHEQSPVLMEALRGISVELQRTYSSCPAGPAYIPDLGEVCGVQFSMDQNWYRGLVQSVASDHKTANILYIDFGNEEDVPVDRIRPLASNIEPIPPCAIECSVAGVQPMTESWSGECCIALKSLVAGKSLKVSVVDTPKSGHTYAVDILLAFLGTQLSTFLLAQGHAAREAVSKKPTVQDIDSLVSASLENFKRLSSGKNENTGARPPEPLTQGVGDSFAVVVTHLQSPDDIICQKVENASVIQELQMRLREHCSQLPAAHNFRPAPGTVCCSQFSEDNQWYRAKVLAYSSEERVCVGYIDFGNSEEVELSHLRPLSTPLLALPMQAIPCALAGVQPVEEAWSEECVLTLRQIVSNRILRVEILGEHKGTALVALNDMASDPQASVAELLLSACYATPATVSHQEAEQTATAAVEPQVSPAPVSPVSQPLVWSCAELPCEGQTVVLMVSVIENPREFYCYIYSRDLQMLMDLAAELKQHCEADAGPFWPKVGEPCCAMFSGDGAWYRAMVQGLFEEKASVYFVDYGNSSQVEGSQLRAITPRLLTLPFQAIRCWLAGVEPLGMEWSSDALQRFQTLVVGQQLSARAVSITERGYGVELESGGLNVAATLVSEQLVKAPGQTLQKETPVSTATPAQHTEKNDREQAEVQIQAPIQTATPKEAAEEVTSTRVEAAAAPIVAASFPVDWTTEELPRNETLQPRMAAVVNPSLFYLLSPSQVDPEKMQQMKMELAVYCSTNQPSSTSSSLGQSQPAPGAACCAQFSGDKNWYRAVVLETSESEASVIYADYGNAERVPYSSILPIPSHLLQLPFQITRCALTGKEHFPSAWPNEVLELFRVLLSDGILATVEAFDGHINLLSVTLGTESGGGHLNTIILEGLQAQDKSPSAPPPSLELQPSENSTASAPATAMAAAAPEGPKPSPTAETVEEPKHAPTTATATTSPASTPGQTHTVQHKAKAAAASVNEDVVQKVIDQMEPPFMINTTTINGPHCSGCCCVEVKTKIDRLEELVQMQLSLIKQMTGQAQS